MPDLKEKSISLLGSATLNGQTVGSKQAIYTVPEGKVMVVDHVVFRDPTATLAGLTDMDLGGNALCDDWLQQITLNAFTATTDYGKAAQPDQAAGPPIVPVKKTEYAAAVIFGAYINTGSTNPASFDIDLFGYLKDA